MYFILFYLSTVRIFRVKAYGQDSLFFWSVPKVMVCRGFQFYYATDHQKLHLLVSFLGETLLGNTQYPVYMGFFLKSAFWRARLEIAIRKRCFLRSSIYQRCMCCAMLWVAKHLFSGACAYTRLHDFFQLQAWVRHYTINHIKQIHSSKLSKLLQYLLVACFYFCFEVGDKIELRLVRG